MITDYFYQNEIRCEYEKDSSPENIDSIPNTILGDSRVPAEERIYTLILY
jgi:hypothetical protein|tara:strand:+ start:875 stop:1024 length:150 start_codon:yes stop_codon:yes gene_type:complete